MTFPIGEICNEKWRFDCQKGHLYMKDMSGLVSLSGLHGDLMAESSEEDFLLLEARVIDHFPSLYYRPLLRDFCTLGGRQCFLSLLWELELFFLSEADVSSN